jgi:hypothetical protein
VAQSLFIDALEVFPLQYHQNEDKIKAELVKCGWKFVSIKGVHNVQYEGPAFRMKNGVPLTMHVSSRIMVDTTMFQKMNPSYTRPSINVLSKRWGSGPASINLWEMMEDLSDSEPNQLKIDAKDLGKVDEDDLLLCSPTVLGFSFGDKLWCKYLCSWT